MATLDALDFDRLRSFLVFSEHLNFTHAAHALHITQPALHTQVSRLGTDLGVTLYRRNGRALELTREGVELARFTRDTLLDGEQLLARLKGKSTHRPVRLAAGEGAYLYLLGKALAEHQRRSSHPLELLTRDRDGTLAALRAGVADLGVAALSDLPSDIDARLLRRVEQVLLLPKKHPLARKRTLGLADLQGANLLLPPIGRPHREAISRALLSAGVRWTLAMEVSGWELMARFVELELGLAIVNDFVRPGPRVALRPISGLPAIHYYLLMLPDQDRAEVRALGELLASPR